MRIVLFYHSLRSCWNNGHAHFLRGYAAELMSRGHDVRIYEPQDGWSRQNLLAEHGERGVDTVREYYPKLSSTLYDPESLDLDEALDSADLVIAHEWHPPEFLCRLGMHRRRSKYTLLFHDSHHRAITDPAHIAQAQIRHYDGVLVYGEVLRELYLTRGWTDSAWVWHEAADTRMFRPLPAEQKRGDIVWIGNWGDDERTAELREMFVNPVRSLQPGVRASVYGVRYPQAALQELARAGIAYRGWLPNALVPTVFAQHRLTVHVPRRPYSVEAPGIPTIRIFEALACGIPLISAPWVDREGMFTEGRDYLLARSGEEMMEMMKHLLDVPEAARALAEHGLRTIRARHTCAHRVDELLDICRHFGTPASHTHQRAVRSRPRAQEMSS